MALTAPQKTAFVLSAEEKRMVFDREARRIAHMSGEEFLARFDAGEIDADDSTPEGRELAYLILLIPFGRQDA